MSAGIQFASNDGLGGVTPVSAATPLPTSSAVNGGPVTSANPLPSTSGTPTSVTATIPNAGSLSPGVVVSGKVASITFPAAWTTAGVTFQGSIDGGATYQDMWDIVSGTATETTVSSANVTALLGKNLRVSLVDWISYTHIKVRSGPSAAPVAQGTARAFVIGMAG